MTHQRKEMLSIHRHGHQGRNISSPFVECQLRRTNCIFSSEIPIEMWRFNNQFFFQDFEIALCYFYIFSKKIQRIKNWKCQRKTDFQKKVVLNYNVVVGECYLCRKIFYVFFFILTQTSQWGNLWICLNL